MHVHARKNIITSAVLRINYKLILEICYTVNHVFTIN